jgi:hypothetical protein
MILLPDDTLILITYDEKFISSLGKSFQCTEIRPHVYEISMINVIVDPANATPVEKYNGRLTKIIEYESYYKNFTKIVNEANIYKIYVAQNFPLQLVKPIKIFTASDNNLVINANYIVNDKAYSTPIVLSGLISQIIAKQDSLSFEKNTQYELHVPKINHIINQFVIYTDIIEPQYYGGKLLQVLHTASLNNSSTAIVDTPHYLNVNQTCINSINIRIYDRTGEPIKFSDEFANVIVKLHFRKKQ